MAHGDEPVDAHDLSSLRILASTGEPWNEGPWRWYFDVVGGGRCPVINISGGTEVGACFLSPHVVEPLSPCSLGGPALGMAVDVFDDAGPSGARRGRRARVHEAVAGHDPRAVARPAALPRHVLVALSGRVVARRLRERERRRAVVPARPLRRHDQARGQAARARPRSRRWSSVIPASSRPPRSACPTSVKGEALWVFVVVGAGRRRRRRAATPSSRSSSPSTSGRRSRPRRCGSRPRCRRPAAPRCCAAAIRAVVTGEPPGDLSGLEDPGTLDAVARRHLSRARRCAG